MSRTARRRCQARADDAGDDRQHGDVLIAPGVLTEHALGHEHEHQQASGERRLHDHERRQQQGNDLQREAQDRQPGAEQPARAPDQAPRERQAQMLLAGRLLGVHRLKRDP